MYYSVCDEESLIKLCIENNWFTEGSTKQYEKLLYANRTERSIEEIALIIWLCTDTEEQFNEWGIHWCRRDIRTVLERAREEYKKRL